MRFRVCWYRWDDLPIPSDVLAKPHSDRTTHLFIEVEHQGSWQPVDATWDSQLSPAFPVNNWGEPMQIAVRQLALMSPSESERYARTVSAPETELDIKRYHAFNKSLNRWLDRERLRQQSDLKLVA